MKIGNKRLECLVVQESDHGEYVLIKPVPGQVVAHVDPGPLQEEYARLFAASPELLRALRSLVLCLSDEQDDYPDLGYFRMVQRRKNAAHIALTPFEGVLEKGKDNES